MVDIDKTIFSELSCLVGFSERNLPPGEGVGRGEVWGDLIRGQLDTRYKA